MINIINIYRTGQLYKYSVTFILECQYIIYNQSSPQLVINQLDQRQCLHLKSTFNGNRAGQTSREGGGQGHGQRLTTWKCPGKPNISKDCRNIYLPFFNSLDTTDSSTDVSGEVREPLLNGVFKLTFCSSEHSLSRIRPSRLWTFARSKSPLQQTLHRQHKVLISNGFIFEFIKRAFIADRGCNIIPGNQECVITDNWREKKLCENKWISKGNNCGFTRSRSVSTPHRPSLSRCFPQICRKYHLDFLSYPIL